MGKKKRTGFEKWLKKNRYLVLILLFVILWVFVPPLINLMITTEALLFPEFFGYVNSENADAWIGFYGAIIGGAITLLGVAWTIIDQNKKREDDMKDAVKPILVASSCKYEEIKGIKGEPGTKLFECALEYKNVGKGILYNPMVFNIEYSIDGKEYGKLQPTFSVKSSVDVGSVADNSVMIIFEIGVLNDIIQALKGRGNTLPLQIVMYVGGKDMFGRDVVTKLTYKTKVIFASVDDVQLPLHRGELTSKVLFSEDEISNVISNANWRYNVHH